MDNYKLLLQTVLDHGEIRNDRTGVGTIALFGTQLHFDLQKGFPAVTSKKLYFGSVAAELAGFLEGTTSAERMRELGTKIWDANSNDDYLGPIYGYQWRNWGPTDIDQLRNVVEEIKSNPTSRRLLVTAWNPTDTADMCLPPCHTHFQFFVREGKYLDCAFYMRSVDLFLGAPFDIASYALLTHIVCNEVTLKPGRLICMFADSHIYLNHLEQVKEYLSRPTHPLPTLLLAASAGIDTFEPGMAYLDNYRSEDAIPAPMAV